MKAAVVRALAMEYTVTQLDEAAESIAEEGIERIQCDGSDVGERLTHLLLAARVRRRMEAGEELKDAFRAEMAAVRDVMNND